MTKKILEEIKEELIKCKNDKDHVWKQTSDWKRESYMHYGDTSGHPEDWIGIRIRYESATFKCQNCGMKKVLKK